MSTVKLKTIGGKVIDNNLQTEEDIINLINSETMANYKGQGSIKFADLPTPSVSVSGFAYDLLDDFTTDERFLEGPGQNFLKGTNVAVVKNTDGKYYYDVLSAVQDAGDEETATDEDINNLIGNIYE